MTPMRRVVTNAIAVSLAAVSLAVVGCSGNALSSHSASKQSELTEIKQRIIALERQQAMLTVELRHLRDEVASRGAQASPGSAKAGTRNEQKGSAGRATARTAVGEGVEENTLPVASTPQSSPARPESPLRKAARSAPSPVPPVAAGAAATPVTAAGQALYDRGYTQFHQGHYRDAEATFQQFLSRYAKTDLGDNALYWIGESRYSLGEYRSALSAFKETVERYPSGNKVPDALLKAGQCLEQLGDKKAARTTYEEILHRFAGTAAATLANERLHALR